MNDINNELVKALLGERKRDRLWRNIRFVFYVVILIAYLMLLAPRTHSDENSVGKGKPYAAMINLDGVIAAGKPFSAKVVVPELIKAFKDKKAKGVILVINSPGGSPVQASIIHDKILQLKKEYKKKVVVMGQDIIASGAYLVATAADKIYINQNTIAGSIGVIMEGFGLNKLLHRFGITRRVFTAGIHKDRLDMYLPLTKSDKQKAQTMLAYVHQNFINDVKQGRQGKLKGNPKELFSGDFWVGQQAVDHGIVDGTGDIWTVLKQQFNVKYVKDYSAQPSLFQQLFKGAAVALHLPSLNMMAPSAPIQEITQ